MSLQPRDAYRLLTESEKKNAELRAENERLRADRARIIALVDKQAENDGLWFQAETCAEAYLQQELRRLHAVCESGGILKGSSPTKE